MLKTRFYNLFKYNFSKNFRNINKAVFFSSPIRHLTVHRNGSLNQFNNVEFNRFLIKEITYLTPGNSFC